MKKQIIKDRYNNKGITLISLVITVIILLILAGIAISQLTSNGLFGKAQLAKEKWDEAQRNENIILEDYENKIKRYTDGTRNYNENCDHISTIIDDFTPEIKEINGTYITVKIPDNILSQAKGYIYLLNNKVLAVSSEIEYSYMNLNIKTEYEIMAIAIDEVGKIKMSSTINETTLDKLYLYKEGNEYKTITGGWTLTNTQTNARSQKNNDNMQLYYSITGSTETACSTNNIIDISNFSFLYVRYKKTNAAGQINDLRFSLGGNWIISSKTTNGDYEEFFPLTSCSSNNKLIFRNYDSYDYIYEVYLTNESK